LKKIVVEGEELVLLPQKALFWSKRKTLIVADLHLGKAAHFRKSGIPIPKNVHSEDLNILQDLIGSFQAETLIFLGDLFHSDYNLEWEDFSVWLKNQTIKIILIKGNHDVLNQKIYEQTKMELIKDQLFLEPFLLSHHPLQHLESKYFNIAGHIHPGFQISGKGKQSMSLPCFYFCERQMIMPAFGRFTGKMLMAEKKGCEIYLIADNLVIPFIETKLENSK